MQTNSRSSTPHVPHKVIKDRLSSNAVFYRSSSSWSNDSSHHSVNNNNNPNREHSPELITNTRNASPTVHEGEINAVVKRHDIRRSSEITNDTTSSLERWRARHRTPLRPSNQTVHEANITVTRKDTPNTKSKIKETSNKNEYRAELFSQSENASEKCVKRIISARSHKNSHNTSYSRNKSTPKQRRAGSAILSNSATREEHLALVATLPYSVRRGLSWHSSYHERRSHSNKSIQANAKTSQRAKEENKEELICCESPLVKRKKLHRSPSVNTHTMNTTIVRHLHKESDEHNNNKELTRESKNKLEKRLSSLKQAVSMSRWQQHIPQNSAEREDRAAPLSISPYRHSASEHRNQSYIQITNKNNNNKDEHQQINEEIKRDNSAQKKRTLSAKATTIKTRTLTPSSKISTLPTTQNKKENQSANTVKQLSRDYNNNCSDNMNTKNVMRRKGSSYSTHTSPYPTICDNDNKNNIDNSKTEFECVRSLEYEEAVTKVEKTSNNIRNSEEEEKEKEENNKHVSEKVVTPVNVKSEITRRRGSTCSSNKSSRGSNDPNCRERFTRSSTPPERVLFEESKEKRQAVNEAEENFNEAENKVHTTKTTTTAKTVAVTESKVSPSTQRTKTKEKEPCVFNIITSPSSSSSASSSFNTSSSYSYTSSSSTSSSSSCAKSYTTSSDEESTATSSVSLLSKPSPFTKALLDEVPNNVTEEKEKKFEEEKEELNHVHPSEDKPIIIEKEKIIGGVNGDEKQEKSNQENIDNTVQLHEEEKQQEIEEKVELPLEEEKKSKQMNSPIYSWLNTPVRDSTEDTDSSSRQTITINTNNNNNETATASSKIEKLIISVPENKSEISKLANNDKNNTNHSDTHENDNENSPSDDRKSRFSFFTSELHDTNANTLLSLSEKQTEIEQQEHENQAVNSHKVKTDHTSNNNSMTMSNSSNSHTNSNTFGSSINTSKSTQNESINTTASTHITKGKLHTETQSRSRLNSSSSSPYNTSSHHRRSSHHPHLTRRQIFIANRVDSMHLPHWAKRTLFEMFDFFTRARFYLVVMIVFALVYTYARTNAFNEVAATFTVTEENRPGLTFLYRYNHNKTQLPRKHPVVIIPGFITGALELWEANLPCMQEQSFITSGFRQRMFGPQMIYLILRNPQCWLDVFSTNKETGLDQDGVRVRADLGFTSVDYFVPGYWVWAKVLVNLADIGYDPQSMSVISYDWRLSPDKCQERDGLYYNIRNTIKFMAQKNKQRVVLISHSYGTNVALLFFKWAEEREHGFMSKYVAYYVNVGGTTLGVPKALSALLLGDAKDTISIPAPARKMLDTFISQAARYNFTRTWSSLIAMLPRGCDNVNSSGLLTLPNGTVLHCREAAQLVRDQCQLTNHTDCVREINKFMRTMDQLPSLPQSLNTTVMCLYGVNKYAESGYVLSGNMNALQTNTSVSSTQSKVDHGVYYDNGDGTVPLLSLSYMCRAHNGWIQNVERVVTVEFLHNESIMSALNLRGSSVSGDHVDILGNYELIDTLLKIVSGIDELGAQKEKDIVSYKDVLSNKTVELHRRVETRLYSDVDKRITTEAQSCLRKPNIPIIPKDTAEKNPFV